VPVPQAPAEEPNPSRHGIVVDPDHAPIPLVAADEEFELESSFHSPSTSWAGAGGPTPPPAPLEMTPPPPPPMVEASEDAAPPPAPEPVAPTDLASPTLAELYFNQGALDRAAEAYRRLIEREPGNGRFRARLAEIEALDRHLRAEEAQVPPPVPALDPAQARRARQERAIARLEGLLAAIKRGVTA
jgi:hypothetical protein